MKRIIRAVLAAVLVLSLGSCDALRSIAGRPTSKDIAGKKVLIAEKIEAERQAHIADSLAAVREAQVRDSIERARADSLDAVYRTMKGSVRLLSEVGGLPLPKLQSKYYILVGTFATQAKMNEKVSQAQQAGYAVQLIPIRSRHLTAVGVCPSETLEQVFEQFPKVRKEKFCPRDAYIIAVE